MARALKLLVVDAYNREGREALKAAGATPAGKLYRQAILALDPTADIDILLHDTPREAPPSAIEAYDGVVWTGSSMTIHKPDEVIEGQIAFCRALFETGTPQFGSCWAIQLAASAAGGQCARNPKGWEFGFARKIRLNESGLGHPVFAGRKPVFDAFASHADIVTGLPEGAAVLASNAMAPVQAAIIRHGRGEFWGVQYHPEYDAGEVACLTRLRKEAMISLGRFEGAAEAEGFENALRKINADPKDKAARATLDMDPDLLDPATRMNEVGNWLDHLRQRREA